MAPYLPYYQSNKSDMSSWLMFQPFGNPSIIILSPTQNDYDCRLIWRVPDTNGGQVTSYCVDSDMFALQAVVDAC
jgi:hypothetical protein